VTVAVRFAALTSLPAFISARTLTESTICAAPCSPLAAENSGGVERFRAVLCQLESRESDEADDGRNFDPARQGVPQHTGTTSRRKGN
jgi:hypothetical protein